MQPMQRASGLSDSSGSPRAGRRVVASVVGALALLGASIAPAGASVAVQEVGPPTVTAEGGGIVAGITVTEGPHSTLSAVVAVATTEDATVRVRRAGDARAGVVPPPSEGGTQHTIPIVGMRAETTYELTITARGEDGARGSGTVSWTTGALPAELPVPDVDVAKPKKMARGVTIFDAIPQTNPEDDGRLLDGFLVGVDDEGEVVWYYTTGPQLADVSQTERGTLLVEVDDTVIREIDVLGNTLREFAGRIARRDGVNFGGQPLLTELSQPIDIDSNHHELYELPNGNLLTLSTELLPLDQTLATERCPELPPTSYVSDIVVELAPDGAVVQEWPLTDIYDVADRPGAELCTEEPPFAPPIWFYLDAEPLADWTHANSVILDEEQNQLLVSIRHLDAVTAIRYHDDEDGPAGELLWELGPDGTLEMLGDGEWPYHQHALELQDDGTLLLYDNGNRRPGTTPNTTGKTAPFSRAVRYDIDADAGTVRQVWEHRDDSEDGVPLFTPYVGDADRLANGNVLITYGGGLTTEGAGYGRMVEVVPGDRPDGRDDEVVFDITVRADATSSLGYIVYRSERLRSLYG